MQTELEQSIVILKILAAEAKATSDKPLKLGNVEFWIDADGPWKGELSYFPATSQWDIMAVQNAVMACASVLRII